MLLRSISALLLGLAGLAHAQVYQCMQPDGRLSYQQAPCAPGVRSRIVDTRPNTVSNAEERALFYRDRERAIGSAEYDPPARRQTAQRQASSTCPTDKQIKDWETSASSVTSKDTAYWRRIAEDGRRCRAGLPPRERSTAQAPFPAPDISPPPMPDPSVAWCDKTGCWDNNGTRYNSAAGSTVFRQDGKVCQRMGGMLHCN